MNKWQQQILTEYIRELGSFLVHKSRGGGEKQLINFIQKKKSFIFE